MKLEKELETALRAVVLACDFCRDAQSQLAAIRAAFKDDRSPVTVADFGSQAILLRILREEFPHDAVVAEEEADMLRQNPALCDGVLGRLKDRFPDMSRESLLSVLSDVHPAESGMGRFWTIDPIDGTKGFLRKEQYAVALALVENGRPILGVLGCPNFGLIPGSDTGRSGAVFYAVQGAGAFRLAPETGAVTPVRGDGPTSTSRLRFCESVEAAHSAHDIHARIGALLGITAPPLRVDSQVKYAAVATGLAAIYLRQSRRAEYLEKIWDHAAGAVIVSEAGGKVTDFSGRDLDCSTGKTLTNNRGIVATSAGCIRGIRHEAVLEAIGKVGGVRV